MSRRKKITKEEFEKNLKFIMTPLNSAEELRAWLYVFLGIHFPIGTVYPSSTHSPVEAMWRIYELIKTGESAKIPEVAMLSSRDSGKTLSAAAIEVLIMLHFRLSICNMSAITSQSDKTVSYINGFFRKLSPYLKELGWKQNSDNKRLISWITDTEEEVYIKVVVATLAGANSEHVPLLFVDEVDVISNPQALNEAKMIPASYKGYQPLTVYLSTLKFAGGLMQQTLENVIKSGGEILRWNIIDITERITQKEAKSDQPKVIRYISDGVPMENLSEADWLTLSDDKKMKYNRFEAYAGIAEHPMLSVMKNLLVDRPQSDTGGLYKTVQQTYNNFKKLPADMADAQLLCNKPSSSGLVYPRFDNVRNVLSVSEAYARIFGEEKPEVTMEELKLAIKKIDGKIVGGGDWGYTDYTSLVVMLILSGDVYLVDSFLGDQLELDDIIKYMKELDSDWGVQSWYVDQAYPAYIKTMKRHGMTVPKFKKVVEDGIAALQYRISDSSSVRRFFVVNNPNTAHIINTFGEYRWETDTKGDPINGKPHHDKEFVSDVQDSIRYPMQVIFGNPGKKPQMTVGGIKGDIIKAKPNEYGKQILNHIQQTTDIIITERKPEDHNRSDIEAPKKGKKGLTWSF